MFSEGVCFKGASCIGIRYKEFCCKGVRMCIRFEFKSAKM